MDLVVHNLAHVRFSENIFFIAQNVRDNLDDNQYSTIDLVLVVLVTTEIFCMCPCMVSSRYCMLHP